MGGREGHFVVVMSYGCVVVWLNVCVIVWVERMRRGEAELVCVVRIG